MVHVTRGLVEVLLDLAREADPESVTASLAVTPARELTETETETPSSTETAPDTDTVPDTDTAHGSDSALSPEVADQGDAEPAPLAPDTPVFTDFYLPDTAQSVSAVFGMDLATPPGQTQGRFVSHPLGRLELERTDDLHEAVFVAVPPWDADSVAAFDRSGRRRQLHLVDAHPPAVTFTDGDD